MKEVRIGFIGAGNHAWEVLYPSLVHAEDVNRSGCIEAAVQHQGVWRPG
ncbi:MAG: hypothetical protein LBE10_00245 [Treponema sp.]|jgi:hypothetical protein|nr:hypothetical protein [Treponema sp.]